MGEQRQRSDSMIILSINKNTKQMTMVSVMRDLYVQIPGYSDNRINSAYAFGGFELLDATIEQNFGVVIDYNVEVNFNGFKDIVDKVGGIDVDLTEEEVEYMNSAKFVHTMNYKGKQNFKAGTNHLDGAQALCYARIRRVGDDFARTQRQRTIIQTVYKKAKEESWTKLLGIYESVADDLTTDMDPLQPVSIAFSGYDMGLDSLNSYRVPSDGSYRNETINRMMVLVPQGLERHPERDQGVPVRYGEQILQHPINQRTTWIARWFFFARSKAPFDRKPERAFSVGG